MKIHKAFFEAKKLKQITPDNVLGSILYNWGFNLVKTFSKEAKDIGTQWECSFEITGTTLLRKIVKHEGIQSSGITKLFPDTLKKSLHIPRDMIQNPSEYSQAMTKFSKQLFGTGKPFILVPSKEAMQSWFDALRYTNAIYTQQLGPIAKITINPKGSLGKEKWTAMGPFSAKGPKEKEYLFETFQVFQVVVLVKKGPMN